MTTVPLNLQIGNKGLSFYNAPVDLTSLAKNIATGVQDGNMNALGQAATDAGKLAIFYADLLGKKTGKVAISNSAAALFLKARNLSEKLNSGDATTYSDWAEVVSETSNLVGEIGMTFGKAPGTFQFALAAKTFSFLTSASAIALGNLPITDQVKILGIDSSNQTNLDTITGNTAPIDVKILQDNVEVSQPINPTVVQQIYGTPDLIVGGNNLPPNIDAVMDFTIGFTAKNNIQIVEQRLGNKLTPTDAYMVTTVQSGDTLSAIAQTHGVTVADLLAANPQITNPDLIYAGEQIYLPIKKPADITLLLDKSLGSVLTPNDIVALAPDTTTQSVLTFDASGLHKTLIDGNGNPIASVTIDPISGDILNSSTFATNIDGNLVESMTYPSGHITRITTDTSGNVVFKEEVPTAVESLTHGLTTMLDALTLVNAIKSGQPLPVIASGLRLANDLNSTMNSSGQLVPNNSTLAGLASVGGGVLSLMSLDAALKRGDTLGAITAGAQTISYGASAYLSFVQASPDLGTVAGKALATDIGSFLNGSSELGIFDVGGLNNVGVLPALNLVNSIVHGDPIGIAVNRLALASLIRQAGKGAANDNREWRAAA